MACVRKRTRSESLSSARVLSNPNWRTRSPMTMRAQPCKHSAESPLSLRRLPGPSRTRWNSLPMSTSARSSCAPRPARTEADPHDACRYGTGATPVEKLDPDVGKTKRYPHPGVSRQNADISNVPFRTSGADSRGRLRSRSSRQSHPTMSNRDARGRCCKTRVHAGHGRRAASCQASSGASQPTAPHAKYR